MRSKRESFHIKKNRNSLEILLSLVGGNMWFKFEKDNPKGMLRIKHVHVAWYDMERNGDCFDEIFVFPSPEDENGKSDRSRVFVHFDNDEVYELKLEKISKEQFEKCNNFYLSEEKR